MQGKRENRPREAGGEPGCWLLTRPEWRFDLRATWMSASAWTHQSRFHSAEMRKQKIPITDQRSMG
jgi:hypothetical protein